MANRNQNFELWAGDNKTLSFTANDENSSALDITGNTIRWSLARTPYEAALIEKSTTGGSTQVNITSSTAGTFEVTLNSSDSSSLRGVYYHEAHIIDGDSDEYTIAIGHATLTRSLI